METTKRAYMGLYIKVYNVGMPEILHYEALKSSCLMFPEALMFPDALSTSLLKGLSCSESVFVNDCCE